ncbi:MAG TPA: transposase [bacterium]|nr:transposase [bacterium]
MPRVRRFLLSKSYYHIMTRGNNRNVVFRSDVDYQYFLELIAKYKLEHPFDLYHYCLMPNHTHFLIQTKQALDFSIFMKKLNLAYFHHYRREYGWVGHFWQDRYKSQAVGKDAYFVQCGKYIELNPVRANIVEKPEDHRYSSYQYYSEGKPDHLITTDFIYEVMGKDDIWRQRQYKQLVVDQVIEESYNKVAWGSDYQRYKEKEKIDRKL